MRFRQKTFVLLTACALMGAGCWYPERKEMLSVIPSEAEGSLRSDTKSFIDADRFAIPELDAQAARRLPGEDAFVCAAFRAGIVNHHVLASDLLAGFFRVLQRCRPDLSRFIILSPDHNLAATASIVTHDLPYRTGGRELATEAAAFAGEQPALFEREHGIGALVSFLAKAYPNASIVPLVVRNAVTPSERQTVAARLSDELDRPDTFVIVSSDMSHYLNEQQAAKNDQQTKRALESGDARFFETANDDFTDNGKSIAIVLQALQQSKWTPLGESISSAYAGSPLFTTTYLVGFWE